MFVHLGDYRSIPAFNGLLDGEDFVFSLHPEIDNIIFSKIAEFPQDRGVVAGKTLGDSPGMEIFLEKKRHDLIGQILFHMVHF